MTTLHRDYRTIIEALYRSRRDTLVRRLRRSFPGVCPATVSDAVADAFLDALERPTGFERSWRERGEAALSCLLYQVAWRKLRGHLRKKASQHEPLGEQNLSTPSTPEGICRMREAMQHALRLIEQAARRFGGKRHRALRSALQDRLTGMSDTEAAREHGIPREYVNRAKRWIAACLVTEGYRSGISSK